MKILKSTFLILFALLLVNGHAESQKYFKIIDATSQAWTGGIPQMGSGVTYTVKVVLTTAQPVKFESIWIGKTYGAVEAMSANYSDGRTLTTGDTVLVRYTLHHYPENSPQAQMSNTVTKFPPVDYVGDALLSFTVGKGTKHRTVKHFTPLTFTNHP